MIIANQNQFKVSDIFRAAKLKRNIRVANRTHFFLYEKKLGKPGRSFQVTIT